MRILVVGSGAVGGYYGGRLALAGNEVVFVARGEHLTKLRSKGLRVQSIDGNFVLNRVVATDDPAQAGRCDLVLVCVKSYDTHAAATALRPVIDEQTIVLSLQNGIENEQILRDVLAIPPPLGGLTQIGVELAAPGVIRHDSAGRIIFGEFDGQPSERARRLDALFRAGGIRCSLSEHIEVMLWDKLAWNAAFNAMTTIARCTVGELLRNPDGRALVHDTMAEVVRVAQAIDIALEADRIEGVIQLSLTEMPELRTSMLQDLERGKRLEHDAINGAVVRAAARGGTSAAINAALYAILSCLDQGARDRH